MRSLEISAKEMNVGADRLAAILAKNAKENRELNIWRQFGAQRPHAPVSLSCCMTSSSMIRSIMPQAGTSLSAPECSVC
jgi:hypothetical protein